MPNSSAQPGTSERTAALGFTPGPWRLGWADGSGVPTAAWPEQGATITTVATKRQQITGVTVRRIPDGVEFTSDKNARPIELGQLPLVVCEVEHQDDIGLDEHLANARLIAAAPDMRAALRGLLDVIHDDLTHERQRQLEAEYLAPARAALALADGTTPRPDSGPALFDAKETNAS